MTCPPEYKGASVIPITWLLLVLGRRWRPEPGWIDRAGRLLGWSWIVWMISDTPLSCYW